MVATSPGYSIPGYVIPSVFDPEVAKKVAEAVAEFSS